MPGEVGALNFSGNVKIANPTMQLTLDMRIAKYAFLKPTSLYIVGSGKGTTVRSNGSVQIMRRGHSHGASKNKKRHGHSWLARFEAPKLTFFFPHFRTYQTPRS